MIEYFFRALSYIFHPLLMPIMGIYFVFELPTIPNSLFVLDSLFFFPDDIKLRLYLIFGVLTFVAPLVSVLIMYWNGMIKSLLLENRAERAYPYFIVTFYFVLAFVFLRFQTSEKIQHPALLGFLFGITVVNLVLLLINTRLKVSAHAAGLFGVCALLIAYNQTQLSPFVEVELPNLGFILVFILISGLVLTGRMYLRAHSLQEILLGMLIGFGIVYPCVKFGIYY